MSHCQHNKARVEVELHLAGKDNDNCDEQREQRIRKTVEMSK